VEDKMKMAKAKEAGGRDHGLWTEITEALCRNPAKARNMDIFGWDFAKKSGPGRELCENQTKYGY